MDRERGSSFKASSYLVSYFIHFIFFNDPFEMRKKEKKTYQLFNKNKLVKIDGVPVELEMESGNLSSVQKEFCKKLGVNCIGGTYGIRIKDYKSQMYKKSYSRNGDNLYMPRCLATPTPNYFY